MSKQLIFDQVSEELDRQLVKWGVQNHPCFDPLLTSTNALRRDLWYEMPTEERAKFLCTIAEKKGYLSWTQILVEEVAEVIAESDECKRRVELIQCIAVLVSWIECIDTRLDKHVDNALLS
jgi:hypothetical protein